MPNPSPSLVVGTNLDRTGVGTEFYPGVSNTPVSNGPRSYLARVKFDAGDSGGTIISHGSLAWKKKSALNGVLDDTSGRHRTGLDFQGPNLKVNGVDLGDGQWHDMAVVFDASAVDAPFAGSAPLYGGVTVFVDGTLRPVLERNNGYAKDQVNTGNVAGISFGFDRNEGGHEFLGVIDGRRGNSIQDVINSLQAICNKSVGTLIYPLSLRAESLL